MTRFGRLLTAALLFAAPAVAQDGVGRSAPLPGDARPDAEVLRKLASQLGGPPRDLGELLRQFGGGGKLDEAGLRRAIERMNRDDQMRMLQDLERMFGGKLPGGLQLPLELRPQVPPVGPQPQPIPPPFPGLDPRPRPQPEFPQFPQDGPQKVDLRLSDFRPQPFQPGFPNGMPNTQAAKEAIAFWEKNIGSLNEMPAVRDALIALANSGLDGPDGKPFWEDVAKDLNSDFGEGGGASSGGFLKWLKDNTSNWSLGAGGGGSSWSPPGSSWGGGSGGGFGAPSAGSIGTVGFVILSLIAAVVIGLFIWKVLPVIREGRAPRPLPGHGPWPVDPRSIRTREQLVTAFEYLSVLECGDRARAWSHVTIADALRQLVPDSTRYADALAHLYSVARYTPEAEPLADGTIAEARGHLCQLARVSPA